MNAIVFSKDRPLQLDAFLRSAARYGPFFRITVLYMCTGEDYAKGYEILRRDFPSVPFIKETVLKKDILDALASPDRTEYFSFFCDDDVFFRPVDQSELFLADDELCYSLRLGINTTYCYIYDKKQTYKGEVLPKKLKWKYEEGEYDFAYPYSIDGHVFRTADLIELIGRIAFHDPHHFEDNLAQQRFFRNAMVSGKESSLVGIPHNKVHSVFDFRSAGGSAYELNKAFLAGRRINPFEMNYAKVHSVHEEIPYVIT